ncbi:hypothetical protein E4U35_007824, partial [Claviceps purpurea]
MNGGCDLTEDGEQRLMGATNKLMVVRKMAQETDWLQKNHGFWNDFIVDHHRP